MGSLLAAAFARLHSGSSLPTEGLWAAAALLEAAGRLGAAVNQPAPHSGQLGTHHPALQVQAGLCTDSRAGDSFVHAVHRPCCIAPSCRTIISTSRRLAAVSGIAVLTQATL